MENNKSFNCNKYEKVGLICILLFILVQGYLNSDAIAAIISATCGITYTFLAGKGLPLCYLFGVTGSSFYGYLSFENALWGNLLLYMCYYVPMQILGYFRWNKHLKEGKKDIIKIVLPKKELIKLLIILFLLTIAAYGLLVYFKDTHPILDSITTIFSIGGMYLTVRRAIEQWIFWMVVNSFSLAMWLDIALTGAKVYSTVIMWVIYLFLAVYFYILWKKEISNYQQKKQGD